MVHGENGKNLKLNSVTSCLMQMTTIICGFIVPRMILGAYGSEINGLVNSIAQFLYIISFMELGIGAVVQSALYRPLAFNDTKSISEIIKSTERFFKAISIALMGYIIILIFVYPHLVKGKFDTVFTVMLLLTIGFNSFLQYFVGIPERLLLLADQKGYIQYLAQTITIVLNTIISAIMIMTGASIQAVKLVSALVFLARPLFLKKYVNDHYSLDRKIRYTDEPISQKWNGVAQHVAAVILDQTDVVILTLFSTLSNVSVYSIYHMVTFGIKSLFLSLTGGIQPLMGEYLAKNDKDRLLPLFDWTEWVIHTGTTFLFVSAGILLVPFITVYTSGVNDADYSAPVFAALITIANAGHCLRLPYNIMILAAGHYKQTQYNYIIAAVMNVLISILSVRQWGLIGVTVGTVVAMIYQTIWMAYYDSRSIIEYPIKRFWKHCFVDIIISVCTVLATSIFVLENVSYLSWFILAIKKTSICLIVSTLINSLFYRDKIVELKIKIVNRIRV